MNDTVRQALDRLLDDDLPMEERDSILQRLETDHEAVAYLAERAMLLSDLRQSLKRRRLQRTVEAAVPEAAQQAFESRVFRLWPWRMGPVTWAAAAVVVLILTLGGVFLRQQMGGGDAVVAEIVESQAAMPAKPWQAGQRVALRQVVIESGRLAMRLANGVSLDFKGPLQAEFVSVSKLRLMHGEVTVDAGKAGKGFVIETVNARVVDLGTRFGVAVGASNETDVAVFDGQVEVFDPAKQPAKQQPKITLTEGEAVRVGNSRKAQRVKMISLGTDAGSLRGGTVSDVVADVDDNVEEGDFHRYYGLLRGGMGEGARLYTTGHTRTWHAMPGEPFPRELVGADVICTFAFDRRETDLQITLMINRPCELYVLPDARASVPEWLQRDFVDTGQRIRSGPWTPRGMLPDTQTGIFDDKAFVTHAVWKKRIMTPGPVVLGPPRAEHQNAGLIMYGIAAEELP